MREGYSFILDSYWSVLSGNGQASVQVLAV